jgi:glycosyltransferase involved in cell wall biosynthesis
LEKKINHRSNDYDIVYSHLPEHTLQLSNYFKNHTGLRPKIVGYCHWYEVEQNDAPPVNTFDANILGTLEMEECGVNSNWLKNLVIERAAKTFNERTLGKLEKIIQPHRLGTDIDLSGSKTELPRSILFNHRSDGYTGWKRFLKLMDKLWEKRKDFKVYMTFPTEDKRDYLVKKKLDDKQDYYNFIKQMAVGVCMFEDYSAWSLSTTDGLSRGIPYLMPKKLCYPEMVGDNCSLFYNNDDQFLIKLEECLNNTELKKQKKEELERIATNLSWEFSISTWFNSWKIFDPNTFVVYQNSKTYEEEIIPFLRDKGKATKADFLKQFGWGYNVDWGKYRNMLRLDNRVKMYVDRYEYVG